MSRITRALFSSKYSIHDLSRCTGEGEERLARFNMPLELGMAMACRELRRQRATRHDWLVLVPKGHKYLRFVSDLGAFDPATHDGTLESVVPKVMSWLAGRPDAIRTPPPTAVLAALPAFSERKHQLGIQWIGDVPWQFVIEAATETVPRL
jgi:hypothetical protein